ncbi:MAG: IS110 family transposase [Planctomycetes bacterium]|nr:IS110 family transposase [Planctomycetota bacterium]
MKQGSDKTDWGDARLLADLVRVGYLPKVWLAPENIRALLQNQRVAAWFVTVNSGQTNDGT